MRATIGAIDFVRIDDESNIHYSVIGGVNPKGICGTGAISAVSSMIKAGILNEKGHIVPPLATGRIRKGSMVIATENETSTGRTIVLTDKDIEPIQQAKAAFASGITCLLHAAGLETEHLKKILIAGAFGNSMDMESLKTIGLIPYKTDAEIVSVGNAAGAGIVMTLLCEDAEREAIEVASAMQTVEFAFMKEFEDEFLKALFLEPMQSVKIKEKMEVTETTGKQQWTAAALFTIIKLNNIIGFLPINIDKTLKAVVDETYNLFNPQMCCIYMIGENNNLELAAFKTSDGLMPGAHTNPTVEACSTLRDGLPYLACRAANCSAAICPNRNVPDDADISHACIPMITGIDIHGVLSITFQPERILSRDKLNVLLSIANQVSMAIQRYKLFEKLKKEKSEIERTYSEITTLNEMLTKKIEELKDTQNRLIQSEKLAATGELTAGLCHEINNPISIILNRIECLEMEAKDLLLPESVLKDLDVISSYAAKVSSIVQDLLIFSRHHPVEFGHVNIKAIIEMVVGMLQDDLNKNKCIVHTNIPLSVPYIYGDADRLEQVFLNLIANAIDAMTDGGDIYIDAEIPLGRPDFILVRIRDEGEGIAEENLHRIFDPFFTTKKLGKGSGLGLSICYGIIKNHGGDITVQSVLNKGSIFSVYLPLKTVQTV